MKMGRRSDTLRLKDILLAVEVIQRHMLADRTAFDADEVFRYFAAKQIEIIGEAAAKLTGELRAGHPEVPWPKIVGMRNRIVHDYAEIDWDVVWRVLADEVAPLGLQITEILHQLEAHD